MSMGNRNRMYKQEKKQRIKSYMNLTGIFTNIISIIANLICIWNGLLNSTPNNSSINIYNNENGGIVATQGASVILNNGSNNSMSVPIYLEIINLILLFVLLKLLIDNFKKAT